MEKVALHARYTALVASTIMIVSSLAAWNPRTPIHTHVEEGNFEAVEELLARKPALIHSLNGHGCTPLHVAAQVGNVEMTHLLLSYGPLVDEQDITGWTPLHHACYGGHLQVVCVLIADGAADVNIVTDDHWHPLHFAAQYGYDEIANLIANQPHTTMSYLNNDGNTPLHLAAWNNNLKIANVLCLNGARTNTINFEGKRPIDIAHEFELKHMVALLTGSDCSVHHVQ